jgi:putative ABC transport system permease protein
MTSLILDIRHAARLLRRSLGVTALAALTLALAIGSATAIFSVVYGVLLRPLPYPESDRLMAVWEVNHRGTHSRVADPNFADFRDRGRTFATMAGYTSGITAVSGASEPTRTAVATVSRDFFRTLGVEPEHGRVFSADETRPDATPAVVVSHSYWRQYLQSTADLSSAHLRIDDRVFTIIGVMPPGFQFPARAELWIPWELNAPHASRTSHNLSVIGRLATSSTVAQASADLNTIARGIIRVSNEQGDYLMTGADVVSLRSSLTSRVGSTLYILLGAVGFLLLVACANVTNLLLSQASARARELAIRHALGAGRRRLVRQFVIEAMLLVTASSLAGLTLAWAGLHALLAAAPADLPRLDDVSMNWTVMGFATMLSALVAVSLGLITAARATRHDPREGLGEGGRGQAGSQAQQRLGRAIVGAQVAITVVLLVGATLLGRSLLRVLSVDPGFRTDHIITMDLTLPSADGPEIADAKAKLSTFYADLFDRLRAIPAVTDVGAANAVPMDGGLPDGMFMVLSPAETPKKMDDLGALFHQKERTGSADYCAASPEYFRALGIPLVRGRLFDDGDGPARNPVALISESLARTRWPGQDPIGRTVEFGNMDGDLRLLTIVGIVGDTREYGLEKAPEPTLYVNLLQRPRSDTTVVMRSNADPRTIMVAARAVLHDLAPNVPPRFRTFAEIYDASLGARNFNLTLVAAFAGTALLLAIAGVYGVMAYNVSRRRREIGVRMALGATPGDVRQIVLGQGLLTTVSGVAVGLAGALALSRTLTSLLFEIRPTDPTTFIGVAALLVVVGAAASYLPARRAMGVNPIETLRQD